MNAEDWLAQVNEPVLEPDLPICDPHHHLWDNPKSPLPRGDARITPRYLIDELVADTGSGHNVTSTVFVECMAMYRATGPVAMRPVGETEFVNGVAAMAASGRYGPTAVAAGIVSFADLTLGADVGAVLDAHIVASSRFRGIRHAAGWDASDQVRNSHTNPTQGLMLDAKFRRGFAELGKRKLTFDAWMYHPQIAELTSLASAFPDTTIILDHFGGPLGIGPYEGKRAEVFSQWKSAIAELAKRPNVVAKIGGLVMPINGFGFHRASRPATSEELEQATRDYYLHTIDCFGPKRCMFESNFPVDKQSCSYRVLWNSFKRIARGFSAADKTQLFHDTAARVYRLAA